MAIDRVFGITELLEAVLLFLPFKDIFVTKGVNKRWRDVIDNSIYLRRATYASPTAGIVRPLDTSQIADPIIGGPAELLPLLEDKRLEVTPLFERKQCNILTFIRSGLMQTPWQFVVAYPPPPFGGDHDVHIFTLELPSGGRTRLPAAYRGTYLTQPPISALYFSKCQGPDFANRDAAVVYNKDGITFGDIERVVQGILSNPRDPRQGHPILDGLAYVAYCQKTQR